jgi:surface polysaccharide O-acyltransferase-like enzyme
MFLNIPYVLINFSVGHLWFLYMIMGIYLYIPIITPWIKSAEKKHFYYYFTIWGISSFSCYLHLFYDGIWGEVFWNNCTIVSSFIGYSGYSVLGAFIKLHLKDKNLYILGIILYVIGTIINIGGYFYKREEATTTQEIEITWRFDSFNVAIASFGVFLLLRKVECKNKIITKILNDISLKSFGMYLVHLFFIKLFGYIFDAPNQFPISGIFVIALFSFISSYIVIKIVSFVPYSQYIIG